MEDRLHQLARQHPPQIHRKNYPSPTTSLIALALQGDSDFGPAESSFSPVARKKTWHHFKHGKALFQQHPNT
jgi:hypothetical protein